MEKSDPITELVSRWEDGALVDGSALILLVYSQLRRIATALFRGEKPGHMLQPTALIHEAYLRLLKPPEGGWNNRHHFFGVAARSMRQILVEDARARNAVKRGGYAIRVTAEEIPVSESVETQHLLSLNAALKKLELRDARQCQVVELRYFVGLSIPETARVLGVSQSTVKTDWKHARTWLRREMKEADGQRLGNC